MSAGFPANHQMIEQELQELRDAKWRPNGQPIRTLEDAREFIESVGFCLMYPLRPAVLVPTFIGACVGNEDNLPTWQHAFADPRAKDATKLMVRLCATRRPSRPTFLAENDFLVPPRCFLISTAGGRSQSAAPPKTGPLGYSPLACTRSFIQKDGPITKHRMREILGGELSEAAIDRALADLWPKLRITRVDYTHEEGAFWDVLLRWAPTKCAKA